MGLRSAITIRPEEASDISAIHAVTAAAFRDMPHSDGSEPVIIDRLRADGDLVLSLVARDAVQTVGHIAVSPVTISDGSQKWFGLGPVSVAPDFQGQGTGSALIYEAIAHMRAQDANGLVLLGNPEFYGRFGFQHDPELVYPGPPSHYFQRLALSGDEPNGTVSYAPAFA